MASTGPTYTSTTDYSTMVTDAEKLFAELKKITQINADVDRITKSINGEYTEMVKSVGKIKDAEEKTKAINAIKESQQQRLTKLKELQSTWEQLSAVNTVLQVGGAAGLTAEQKKYADHKRAELTITEQLLRSQLGISDLLDSANLDLNKLIDEYKDILKLAEKRNKEEEQSKKLLTDIKSGAQLFFGELTGITSELFSISGFLTNIVKKFNEFEDAAFEIRKTMGLIVGEDGASGLYSLLTEVTTEMARIGVTAKDVSDVFGSVSKTFGSSAFATKDILENFSAFSTSLGIASDTSSKSLRNLMGISQSSAESNKSMIGFAKSLANAAQVPLVEIMQDLSTISESVRTTFRGSSDQLVKSAVQARKLGITLEQTGQIAEKLLNFQESINAEIEASVLLGKNISFNDARVLAYRGDILGASKSVLETVKKTAELNKLDYFTLKAIAEASGLTVGQLQDSIQIEKDLNMLRSTGNEEARKLAAQYEILNGLSGEGVKTESELAMERIKNTNNLAQQKQILAEIQAVFYDIAAVLMPVFKFVGKIAKAFGELNPIIKGIILTVLTLGFAFIKLGSTGILATQGLGASIAGTITAITTSLVSAIGSLGAAGVTITALGEVLGPAALILLAFGASVLLVGGGVYFLAKGVMILVESFGKFVEILSNLSGDQFGTLINQIFALNTAMSASFLSLIGFSIFIGKLATFAAIMLPLSYSMGVFADSFAKFINSFDGNNLNNVKLGIGNVKSSLVELRGELKKFNDKDINVLEKLSTLNKSASINPAEKEKKDESESLKETIKSAIVDGMRQVKIYVTLDGRSVGTGMATAMSVSQPSSVYNILTKQGNSV